MPFIAIKRFSRIPPLGAELVNRTKLICSTQLVWKFRCAHIPAIVVEYLHCLVPFGTENRSDRCPARQALGTMADMRAYMQLSQGGTRERTSQPRNPKEILL